MYLTYLDDSGVRQKDIVWQLLSAVIIDDRIFRDIEVLMGVCVEDLIPADRLEDFHEFHASELYRGSGIFDGIPEEKRFHVIHRLLTLVRDYKLPIVYGAVDVQRLRKKYYASAVPADIAFRICAIGIEDWISKQKPDDQLGIIILDNCDKADKDTIKKSFRQLRKKLQPPHWTPGQLWHVLDDMFFGDSKDSVGIQLADVCSYFIAKHLQGGDEVAEGFYQTISDYIVHSKIEPE